MVLVNHNLNLSLCAHIPLPGISLGLGALHMRVSACLSELGASPRMVLLTTHSTTDMHTRCKQT
eukprot:30514-Eustigmatos_ZCMA.PRE.1